ncbi:MAG: hypothetical protein RQ751_01960, partial [Longimicrobiales bacterium]|nr:hypothetical protein [Longimicrobiales bacterium]
GWGYLALEALIWTGFALERGRGHSDRTAYRDLAWRTARGAAGERVDGDFTYYERMSLWDRSGAFDADPATPGVQPESDPATFNGDAWRLAANIFLGGRPGDRDAPGYGQALAFYRERAYGEAFLWDWTGHGESQMRFRDLIERSDDHLRNASLILGGAVLNRLASGLDALLSNRTGVPTSVRLETGARGVSGTGGLSGLGGASGLWGASAAPGAGGGGAVPAIVVRVVLP